MNDMDEPTAWEEINPVTVSAPRPELPCKSSAIEEARKTFRNELTACLALTAPAGMTEEARRDWLTVAWNTLKHIPPHILSMGAAAARKTCDHPSKIVPAIIAETKEMMSWHNSHPVTYDHLQLSGPRLKKHVMERRGEAMSDEDTAELNRILEWAGACARYRSDGSRYVIETEKSA